MDLLEKAKHEKVALLLKLVNLNTIEEIKELVWNELEKMKFNPGSRMFEE